MLRLQRNELLTNEDKTWKPRNKQAAFVVRPASGLHLPPAEKRFLPSPEELAAQRVKEAQESADRVNAIAEARRKEVEARPKPARKEPVAKCKWAIKQLRAIHRRKGLPAPTWEEIRAYQKQQPGYGSALHNTQGDTRSGQKTNTAPSVE